MGAKLNACLAALPAAGGIADATKFASPQKISTQVVDSVPAEILTCGISITQTAQIILSGTYASWVGCPQEITYISKAANLDQFTLSNYYTGVYNLQLEGNGATYTGNGIVTVSSGEGVFISNNLIDGEAGDAIYDDAGTYAQNLITGNHLTDYGTHAYESTSTSQQSTFQGNFIYGYGNSTGAAILNTGSSRLANNWATDGSGTVLVDDSSGGQQHAVTGNTFIQTGGWPGLKTGATSMVAGNSVYAGGSHGPAIDGATSPGATISGNGVNSTNADGIDGGNSTTISDNHISLNISGVSGKCGVNLVGDTVGFRSHHNQITISDDAADVNYGTCDTPTGSHNLDVVFDGDQVSTTLSGGASVYGHWTNNAAGINTNWSLVVENLGCVHLTACIKRTDAQNNTSVYKDIQQADAALDAGGGSSADIFIIANEFGVTPYGSYMSFTSGACENSYGATTVNTGSATTTTGLNCLPANAFIDYVVYRVTTAITTATSFTVGVSGSTSKFCSTQSTLTLGATGTCTAQINGGVALNASNAAVVVTFNGTPGAGAMRLIVYYHLAAPPTS